MTSFHRFFLNRLSLFALLPAILISASSAKADILANWKLDTTPGRFDQTSEEKISPEEIEAGLAPSIVANGVKASPVSLSQDSTAFFMASIPGHVMSVTGGSSFATRPWNHGSENFIEFTVSAAEPGTTLNITGIEFYDRAIPEFSNFSEWILYSSLDDFTDPLAGGQINMLEHELELQSASLNLKDVEKISFRLTASGHPTASSVWIIDNLMVQGTVAPKR